LKRKNCDTVQQDVYLWDACTDRQPQSRPRNQPSQTGWDKKSGPRLHSEFKILNTAL